MWDESLQTDEYHPRKRSRTLEIAPVHALRECFVALHLKDGCCLFRDLPNHPRAGTAWKEKALPGGIGSESEHGLAHPIKGSNQGLGTAARRYIPAWDMLCSLGRMEGYKEGWLASTGSSRSRRLVHGMVDVGSA